MKIALLISLFLRIVSGLYSPVPQDVTCIISEHAQAMGFTQDIVKAEFVKNSYRTAYAIAPHKKGKDCTFNVKLPNKCFTEIAQDIQMKASIGYWSVCLRSDYLNYLAMMVSSEDEYIEALRVPDGISGQCALDIIPEIDARTHYRYVMEHLKETFSFNSEN